MSDTADTGKMREGAAPGIREVSVAYGRTVNLGNYESERLQVGLTATVGADEDAVALAHDLMEWAQERVASQLARLRRQRWDEP